jgi:hypothetical protein
MRYLLIFILFLLISLKSFSQNNNYLDNNSILTEKEYSLLDSLLVKKNNYSFKDKKVAFISGHSVTDIQTKKNFFEVHIYDYLNKEIKPIISYRLLNEQEKNDSGGFDVIVMQTPKVFTKKQMMLNIKKLKATEQEK